MGVMGCEACTVKGLESFFVGAFTLHCKKAGVRFLKFSALRSITHTESQSSKAPKRWISREVFLTRSFFYLR